MSNSSPEPQVYRGALIGLGGIGRNGHLPAFRQPAARRLTLAATVDAAPGVAPEPGIPHFTSTASLAGVGGFDFMDICTPTASHVDLVLWALGAGYHVLCEKPVAIRRADAEKIAAAARRAGRVVYPCHQYRFNPAWRQIRAWLDAGAIGRWHLAEFKTYRPFADKGASTGGTPWRGTKSSGLGGVLLDHGAHLVYQMLDVAGAPRAIRAWTGVLSHADYDVEDTASVLLDYGDRIGTFFLTWAGRKRETSVRFIGEKGEIGWVGGTLTLDADGASQSLDLTEALDKKSYAGWFAELLAGFARAMDTDDIETPLADIMAVAGVLEDAYAAANAVRVRPALAAAGV